MSADPSTLPPLVESSVAAIAAPWAHTNVKVFQTGGATPLGGTSSPGGFFPAQIRHAYGIDQVLLNGTIQGDGTGQTIAIVDAYHTPTMAADLAAFDAHFGIPAPPSFTQVAQDGSTNYPSTDPAGVGTNNWELETALDVEWAHALAPGADILLVEASSTFFSDLASNAVDYARNQPNVVAVSMSWGGSEFSTEASLDSAFTTPGGHAGVVFLAATGDTGSPGLYPAYSPNVLAVGGTTLSLNGSNNITTESGWSGSGGGISQFENQPSFQNGVVTQSSTRRTIPDVAFDANQNTGVPVYDSYNNGNVTPWIKVGGTSFGSPSWAALVAIAEQGRALAGQPVLDSPGFLSKIYTAPTGDFNDIIGGSNGPYSAVAGYDLVTGLGTPKANFLIPDIVGKASISGTVFNDTNANGTLDGGEAGLAGWTVYQDINNNSTFDPSSVNSIASTDVSKAIPTHTTITSSNGVSGLVGAIVDLNVTLNISFSRDASLVLTLISPNNTRITLANKVGGSGANFTNTVFDDSAAIAITSGTAPFSGTYRPASPLAALIGTAPNGTWKLEVANSSTTRIGSVTSWSLQVTAAGEPNTASDGNGNYVFPGLAPGSYRIGEILQAPYTQTSPPGGIYTLNLATTANATGENFGNLLPPSAMPSGVALLAISDTGSSSSDRITKLNNSSPATALQFQVSGTVAGATVAVLAGGVPIGSATAAGSTTTVTTDGSTLLANGDRTITAQQTEPGKSPSPGSPPLTITIDTTRPTPNIASVTPDPRITPVSQMTITFSEPVSGFDLSDLQLTRDGGLNLLSGAQSVISLDGISWTLADLTTPTGTSGNYRLSLAPTGSPMVDVAGNADTAAATTTFTIDSLPVLDLDGVLSGSTGFASTWNGGAGPIHITALNDATVTDADTLTLASITVTETLTHAGDMLAATDSLTVTSSFNGVTGVLTLLPATGTSASLADFETVLRTITYDNTSTSGGPQVLSETVAFVANDGTAPSVAATATITIVAPPIVDLDGALSGGADFTSANWANAGSVSIVAPGDATVFDGEGASLTSLTATISSFHTGDVLTATPPAGISASYDGAGILTLTNTGSGSLANFQTALRSITYDNTNGGPGVASVSVNFQANDGTLLSNTAVATVPIVNAIVDLDGVLSSGTGFSSTWTNSMLPYAQGSGGGNVFITAIANATVVDAESANLTGMTVSMAPFHGGDWLSANNAGTSIAAPSYNAATGVLTLSGTDTLANYQQVLRTVKYTNVSLANGGPIATSVTANIQANDGLHLSNIAVASIAVNVPPIVDLNGNAGGIDFLSVWRNTGAVAIADPTVGVAGASVIDGRSANLTQVTATIVPFNANNVLAATTTGTSITATYVPGTGVLTLSGTDTTAHYQQVLRTVTYNNTGGGPGASPITVNFVGTDGTNSSVTAVGIITINLTAASNVVGRNIFYNKSGFDGTAATNLAVNVSDDAAIASDKVAYIAGTGAATFANVTSYDKGINGVMVDIAGTHGVIVAGDFIFKVGNSNFPASTNASAWSTAGLTPLTVTTRAGAGGAGRDRVEITWDDVTAGTGFSSIAGKWLEVILKGNDTLGGSDTNTGLATSDVFFFGNAPGESGDGATQVNATDVADTQKNPRNLANLAPISFNFDYSRDKQVNATDIAIAQTHPTTLATGLKLINVGGAGPFAPLPPDSSGAGAATTTTDAGVSSALASTSTSSISTSSVNVDPGIAFGLTANSAWQHGLGNADWSGQIDEPLLELLAIGRWHSGSRRR